MRTASFIFNFDSKSETDIIFKSIKPEIKNKIPKTNAQIKKEKNRIFLNIASKDTSSLRAAINSYLRWIKIALEVKKRI